VTWLFTQVWLFSALAFFLGALITWLLFVPRLQRRTKALRAELYRVEHDEGTWRDAAPESTALDLVLGPDHDDHEDRSGEVSPAERTAAVEPAFTRRLEVPSPGESTTPDADGRTLDAPLQEEGAPSEANEVLEPGGDRVPRRVPRKTDHRASRVGEWPEPVAKPTVPAQDSTRSQESSTAPEPPAFPEKPAVPEDPAVAESAAAAGTSGSDWFRRPGEDMAPEPSRDDWTEVFDEPRSRETEGNGQAGTSAPRRPGGGTSVFDPVASRQPDHDRGEGAESTAETVSWQSLPQAGEEKTDDEKSGAVRGNDDAESSENPDQAANRELIRTTDPDTDPAPLPRRTPGAGPRPGRQNLASSAAATPKLSPEQFTETSSGDDSRVVKGHFASRLYHTPESPHYERIVAEVSFASASEAEQAGFEPWDGWHRS
jgi:hypothetical protein